MRYGMKAPSICGVEQSFVHNTCAFVQNTVVDGHLIMVVTKIRVFFAIRFVCKSSKDVLHFESLNDANTAVASADAATSF